MVDRLASEPVTVANPVSTLDQVETEFAQLFRDQGIAPDDPDGSARLLRILLEMETAASPSARAVLARRGIRDRWNAVFAERRAAYLADWLTPLLRPPVLDVLAGDCTVAQAIADRLAGSVSPAVVTVERPEHYPIDREQATLPFFRYAEDAPLPAVGARSVLICAVLHHEEDPDRLLDHVATLDAPTWVVVENCLFSRYGPDFHQFMDVFFNRCLNDFGLSCTPQHRTADGWHDTLSRYGEVTHREDRPVPGIPFPYTVFVVRRC